jgi:carbonic anhydrase
MDARIDPLGVLGLTLGDAHVIRSAGATLLHVDDVLGHVLEIETGTLRDVIPSLAGHSRERPRKNSGAARGRVVG